MLQPAAEFLGRRAKLHRDTGVAVGALVFLQQEFANAGKAAEDTGLRAILADQGQNDWPEKDDEKIIANFKAWIEQARKDAGFPDLAVVVNRQSLPDGFGQIRRVQDRTIKEHPHCFPGADYDTLAKDDTTDKVHLSEAGEIEAARLWAYALDASFFKAAVPLQPN